MFESVVKACMAMKLLKGEGFAVDASVMEADASRYHGVSPEEADWSAPEIPPIIGTGYVVHEDGVVATNEHVVKAYGSALTAWRQLAA